MVTQEFNIDCFWDESYKYLDYHREEFNNTNDICKWTQQGYRPPFTGFMCDMRKHQPQWNNKFIDVFEKLGWQNVGTNYYRMDTGTVLPEHTDTCKKYIELFNLQGQENKIRRAVIFLEDWASGRYFELAGMAKINWRCGDCKIWQYDVPHMAANIGTTPRYTLQITGHIL